MKYIKTYESFRNKKENKVNEEFLGGLFKGLKDKLSLGFSKMFGNAAKVDKIIEDYKKEVMVAWAKRKDALIALAKFQKAIIDGAEEDPNKFAELTKNLATISENYKKQKDLIKKKFDIKFNEVIKDEGNDKIKNYINLKKIEMEQELLQQETNALLNDSGLTEDDIKDNKELTDILKSISDRAEQSKKAGEDQTKALSDKDSESEEAKFNFDEAKKDPENYKWEDSKYVKDYKFEKGDEIKVWMNKSSNENLSTFDKEGEEYKGTTLFIASDEKQKELSESTDEDKSAKIAVTGNKEDLNSGFTILKSKIITTKKDEEEAAKKAEEAKKEEETKKPEGEETV